MKKGNTTMNILQYVVIKNVKLLFGLTELFGSIVPRKSRVDFSYLSLHSFNNGTYQ